MGKSSRNQRPRDNRSVRNSLFRSSCKKTRYLCFDLSHSFACEEVWLLIAAWHRINFIVLYHNFDQTTTIKLVVQDASANPNNPRCSIQFHTVLPRQEITPFIVIFLLQDRQILLE